MVSRDRLQPPIRVTAALTWQASGLLLGCIAAVTMAAKHDTWAQQAPSELGSQVAEHRPVENLSKLVAALKNKDARVRGHAADKLSGLDSIPEETARAVMEVFCGDDTGARLAAARVLRDTKIDVGMTDENLVLENDPVELITDRNRDVAVAAANVVLYELSSCQEMAGRSSASCPEALFGKHAASLRLVAALNDAHVRVRLAASEVLSGIARKSAPDDLLPVLLRVALEDQDENVRANAIFGLSGMGARALAAIVTALDGPHAAAAREAVPGMTERSDLYAVPILIDALAGRDAETREAIVIALNMIEEGAVPALLVALKRPEDDVRAGAALALGVIGRDMTDDRNVPAVREIVPTQIVPALAGVLKDPNPTVRAAAAHAFESKWLVPPAEAAPDLVEVLRMADDETRSAVVQALARTRPASTTALSRAFTDNNPVFRKRVVDALAGDPDAEPVLQLALDDPSVDVRLSAVDALARALSAWAVLDLRNALRDAHAEVRARAVRALSGMARADAGIVTDLIVGLHDEDHWVRGYAADGLKGLGPDAQAAVGPLIERLGDDDGWVRQEAFAALAHVGVGSTAARNALVDVLQSGESQGRWQACRALADMGPAGIGAVPALAAALGDPDMSVRTSAAEALQKMVSTGAPAEANPRLAPALLQTVADSRVALVSALHSPDAGTQRDAARRLALMGAAAAPAAAELVAAASDPDRDVRASAIDALAEIGGARAALSQKANVLVPALTQALREEDATVQALASAMLDQVTSLPPDIGPALQRALADDDAVIRAKGASGLTRLASAAGDALPAITRRLDDREPTVRVEAVWAIAAVAPAAALPRLQVALHDPDPRVRVAAAMALGTLDADVAWPAALALAGALADPDGGVRFRAIDALEGMISKHRPEAKVVRALVHSLQDEDRCICWTAARMLASIGELPAVIDGLIGTLTSSPHPAPCVTRALENIGAPALPALRAAFAHANTASRARIARVIENIDPGTVPATPIGVQPRVNGRVSP